METLEKKGKGSALLPFLLFIVIYLGAGLYFQAQGVEMAFYQFPSVTAMFIALLLAFCQGKGTIDQKFTVFAKGAANENVLTMLMIYILAGAFSTVASAMGGVDATVNLGLSVIPVHFLAAGVFVISAFMGTATGTSMGTISAIVPIAVGVAEKGGLSLPLFLGACVGGAMFGDNLSMISDTTIAATAVVPRMEPTERSMPPVRMMKVIPAASTMLIEAWRVIFSRLLSVKKLGAIKPKTATIRMRIGRMPTVCIRSPINIFFAEADFATGAEVSFGMLIVALP